MLIMTTRIITAGDSFMIMVNYGQLTPPIHRDHGRG
jgi:hypothetical protein